MTPYSIAGMAKLNGLELVALTDHNTTRNCRTFLEACGSYGLIGVPGMELTTAEDIHMVCLFPTLEAADAFEAEVRKRRILIKNRPEVFGNQLLIGAEDEVIGTEEHLLINATSLTLSDGKALAEACGGTAYPAHIDREANGIIATLGELPDEPDFSCVEFHDASEAVAYETEYALSDKRILVSSDAHRLWDLSEGDQSISVDADDEPDAVRAALIQKLREKRG